MSSRAKRLLARVNRTDVEIALDSYLADKDSKLILKLPSWEHFKKIIGKDQNARTMFVEMYTAEGNLLAALDHDPKGFETALQHALQQIQQNLYTPWGQVNQMPMCQVVALLFAATDTRATTNINSFYMVTNLFYQQNIQQGFKANAGARKLLVQFFEQRTDQNTMRAGHPDCDAAGYEGNGAHRVENGDQQKHASLVAGNGPHRRGQTRHQGQHQGH